MRTVIKWLLFGIFLLVAASLVLSLTSPKEVRSAAASDPPDEATQSAFAQGGCSGCHTIPGIANAG